MILRTRSQKYRLYDGCLIQEKKTHSFSYYMFSAVIAPNNSEINLLLKMSVSFKLLPQKLIIILWD